MDPAHRALLRRHRLRLSDQLLVCDHIVPFLFQEEVLTEAQVQDVQARPTDTARARRLLELLPSRGPGAFGAFLRSLDHYGWVRDALLRELRTGPEPGSEPGNSGRRLPPSVLRSVPSDRVLSRVASRLGPDWDSVLLDLGLSSEDVFRCRADHGLSVRAAALDGLVRWRRAGGRDATLERLLQSLEAAGMEGAMMEEELRDLTSDL